MPDFYAIRHENGNFLPARLKYSSNWKGNEKTPPRLFTRLGDAKGWITNWRKGRVAISAGTGYDPFFGEYPEPELIIIEVPERHSIRLEIVPVILTFCQPI